MSERQNPCEKLSGSRGVIFGFSFKGLIDEKDSMNLMISKRSFERRPACKEGLRAYMYFCKFWIINYAIVVRWYGKTIKCFVYLNTHHEFEFWVVIEILGVLSSPWCELRYIILTRKINLVNTFLWSSKNLIQCTKQYVKRPVPVTYLIRVFKISIFTYWL